MKTQPKQRISYVDPATITDPAMLDELDRCRREGTPRPESQAVRAHVPAAFWSFRNTWRIEHHQVLAGTDGSMAPGFDDYERLTASKSRDDYWAKKAAKPARKAG